jgi:AAA domain
MASPNSARPAPALVGKPASEVCHAWRRDSFLITDSPAADQGSNGEPVEDAFLGELKLDYPNESEIRWLFEQGVSDTAMLSPTLMRAGKILDNNTFDFDGDGIRAVVFEEGGDLSAWNPKRNLLATWQSVAFALGEEAIWNPATYFAGDALRVHATPLDWLLADRDGIVINGRAWFGRRVTRCAVLHVAAERLAVVKRRYAAWRIHHGVEDLPLAVLGSTINLCSSFDDAKQIVDACRRLEDLKAFGVGLIGIETVNRVLAGGSENDPAHMGALIDKVAFIQQEIGCTVELVHHIPQDGTARLRGHGALLGACDTTLCVSGSGSGVRTCNSR